MSVEIRNLNFRYSATSPLVLADVSLSIAEGSRCLIIGANGAGKSTLLRLIAGKHLIDHDAIRVLGRPAFHDTALIREVALLTGRFDFEVDVHVAEILAHQTADPQRIEQLLELLAVDPQWRMHAVSDGQRRRVQILLALINPYRVLLLDEITTDLDLVARADLLRFLREESETRRCTLLYATHILDRLEPWATHLILVDHGRILVHQELQEIDALKQLRASGSRAPLADLAEQWLRQPPPPDSL